MAIYKYKILDQSGRVQSGVSYLSFDNVGAVYEYFEQCGRSVIYVKSVSWLLSLWYQLIFAITYRQISREDITEFIRSLAVMLKAGVPLLTSLDDAAEHLDNPSLSRVVADLKMSIESGIGLSKAMQKHASLFPDSVIYMTRMGEESGLLDSTLMDAADNMRRITRIGVDVKKALIYPVFALIATIGALIFWLQFTVPSLADLYKMMQVDLPVATKMVLAVSESLQMYLLWYVIGTIVTVVGIGLVVKRSQRVGRWYDIALLKIPVIKQVVAYSNMAFIFEYFALLLRSGVDVYSILGVISGSMNNRVYQQALEDIRSGVERGNGVADEILRNDLFPKFVGRMVKTGETSGSLSDQLQYIADEYQLKLTDIIDRLKTLIEPFAIIVIGGLMLLIIGALFFPIYQLIGSIGGSGL